MVLVDDLIIGGEMQVEMVDNNLDQALERLQV